MANSLTISKQYADRIRVVSNYIRLLVSFVIGLVLVRLLLQFGTEAYGLIIFLGAGTGIIGSLRETVSVSMVPELGAAYHDEDQKRFPIIYSSAFLLSSGLALVSLLIAGGIGLALPYFNIPAEMLTAARWFLVAKAVQAFVTVLLSPGSNMFLVTERMVSYNLWTIAEKLGDALAACFVLWTFNDRAASELVILFGVVSAATSSLIIIASTIQISWADSRLTVRSALVSRAALQRLTSSFGWISSVTLAINLYTRLTAVIMNLALGLLGNVVFGIAVQVAGNLRQLSMGLVTGIDAVAARMNTKQGDQAIRDLSYYSTRAQGLIVLPGVCWLLIYVEPFVRVWLGGRLENPEETIPLVTLVSSIMILGFASRSLSEGWMRILSGAGHARKYAPIVLVCGLLNPLLAIVLLQITSGVVRFVAPTIALSLVMIALHSIALPIIVARHLQQPVRRIIGPLFRPLIASCLTSVVAFLWLRVPTTGTTWDIFNRLAIASILFGACYVILALTIATSRREKARFWAWMRGEAFAEMTSQNAFKMPKFATKRNKRAKQRH